MAATRRWLGWGAVAVLPLLLLVLLRRQNVPDPTWMGYNAHFLIVLMTSGVAIPVARSAARAAAS